MKKIISLFARNYDGDRLVRDEIVPGAEWVVAGEGIATEKIDGTCCLVRAGKLYKRHDVKKGRTPPSGWEPCEEAPDAHTGHWPGWLLVGDGPEDRWHREAWEHLCMSGLTDRTMELLGPKVQGNPYGLSRHELLTHGRASYCVNFDPETVPRTFDALRRYFETVEIEGVVWHHPDGRMVKIKRRDFGLSWPIKTPPTTLPEEGRVTGAKA